MKVFFSFLLSVMAFSTVNANTNTYVGSTPAHSLVRDFLQISSTDSIDFIRWKLDIGSGTFKLQCKYGLSKPGTAGFSNEKIVAFEGQVTKSENNYILKHQGKSILILELNANVLHFVDLNNQMLTGNGGYSYALNSINPIEVNEINIRPQQVNIKSPLVFEGRTPCQELAALLGLTKNEACDKMKWYFLFYTDSVTGKPSYFLMAGMGYTKESMPKGQWQITTEQNGRVIYKLYSDKWTRSLNLLRADEDILLFIDANGRLLVGNENFSYTLNRKKEEYLPIKR